MEVGDDPLVRKNAKVAALGAGMSGVITTSDCGFSQSNQLFRKLIKN